MITFKEDTHKYFNEDGVELISVTTLMQKHGLAPSYAGVDKAVLNAKAQRGSLIHKEIEDFIKEGKVGFTKELSEFINTPKGEVLESEGRVYNDIVAGTCDLILYENGEYIIGDIKTTYTLHKEAVSWQLSIYAYLFNVCNPSIEIKRGQAYHFDKDGNLNVVEIPLKPIDEIGRLMVCERRGETYKPNDMIFYDTSIERLTAIEEFIKFVDLQKKEAEEQAQEVRAAIMAAMEKNGVTKFENERITITYYVAPTTRTSIDSARLKKEMPQVAEQYTKTSNVKASLRITLKEVKE